MGSGSESFRLRFGPDSERALAICAGRVGKAPEVNQTLWELWVNTKFRNALVHGR